MRWGKAEGRELAKQNLTSLRSVTDVDQHIKPVDIVKEMGRLWREVVSEDTKARYRAEYLVEQAETLTRAWMADLIDIMDDESYADPDYEWHEFDATPEQLRKIMANDAILDEIPAEYFLRALMNHNMVHEYLTYCGTRKPTGTLFWFDSSRDVDKLLVQLGTAYVSTPKSDIEYIGLVDSDYMPENPGPNDVYFLCEDVDIHGHTLVRAYVFRTPLPVSKKVVSCIANGVFEQNLQRQPTAEEYVTALHLKGSDAHLATELIEGCTSVRDLVDGHVFYEGVSECVGRSFNMYEILTGS